MGDESIELPEEQITQFGPVTVYVTVCTSKLQFTQDTSMLPLEAYRLRRYRHYLNREGGGKYVGGPLLTSGRPPYLRLGALPTSHGPPTYIREAPFLHHMGPLPMS